MKITHTVAGDAGESTVHPDKLPADLGELRIHRSFLGRLARIAVAVRQTKRDVLGIGLERRHDLIEPRTRTVFRFTGDDLGHVFRLQLATQAFQGRKPFELSVAGSAPKIPGLPFSELQRYVSFQGLSIRCRKRLQRRLFFFGERICGSRVGSLF